MTYRLVEDAVIDQLVLVPGLSSKAVSRGDFKVLSTGPTKAAVTLYAGVATAELRFGGDLQYTWSIALSLCTKYQKSDDALHSDAADLRQAVLDRFAKYRQLDNESGVFDSMITSGQSDLDSLVNFQVGTHKYHKEM